MKPIIIIGTGLAGYTLARERRRITVGDVVRVVDQLDAEADNEPISKAELGDKVIAPLWAETQDAILAGLDQITMEDLCRRARKLGIAHGARMKPDFNI